MTPPSEAPTCTDPMAIMGAGEPHTSHSFKSFFNYSHLLTARLKPRELYAYNIFGHSVRMHSSSSAMLKQRGLYGGVDLQC